MASTVGSLFGIDLGTDRQDILSQIVKERQASNIAKTQGLGKFAGLAQSGMESAQMFGDIVKQSVGVKDPRLAQQDNRDQAVAKANARIKDPSDQEEVYRVMAEEFQAAGLTKEALVMSSKLSEVKMKNAEYGLKAKKAAREETEFKQKNIEFYTKNPDQASIELQRLAKVLEANPNDTEALRRYEEITAAGTTGAMQRASKQEKADLEIKKDKAIIDKYKQDTKEAQKFGPEDRLNMEIDAARLLLKGYGIDPSKPLQGQNIPASILYGPAGQSIVQASRKALQKKTTENEVPYVSPQPGPAAAPTTQPKVIPWSQVPTRK
jgi:hypothetical protein